ncbi:MAG: FapA family protein [Brevibacillus sp.]|nr:FapA family protein [Brevibacillus sp.]
MTRSIVSRGKNVADAVETAIHLLGTTKKNVEIEIIQLEKKGFLGIGAKPAVVKVTVKQAEESASTPCDDESLIASILQQQDVSHLNHEYIENLQPVEKIETNHSAQVWVTDGQVFCQHSATHYPTITPGKGVMVYKNGQVVVGTTVITEKDQIRICTDTEESELKWKITIDEDELTATCIVEPGYKKRFRLKDHPPAPHVELEVEEEIIEYETLHAQEVLDRLEEIGVVRGIQREEILKACQTTEPGEYVVARGMEPTEGKDGWIEFVVDVDSQTNHLKERSDGTVDFREITHIPSVKAGQVIGIIHPPVEGKEGYTVKGIPIPPKPVRAVLLHAGTGVGFVEEDAKIVATESGRPQIEHRGNMVKVSILPKLTHPSDVDLKSGNIHFNGDVEVLGAVEEEMEVDAEGDVLLHGSVNVATVKAGNSIKINGNVIRSEIVAGKSSMVIQEMSQLLGEMSQQMRNLVSAVELLYQHNAFKLSDFRVKGLSPLLKILLESKFKSFVQLVKQYVDKTDKEREFLDRDWLALAEICRNSFLILHPNQLKSLQDLVALHKKLEVLYQISHTPPQPNSSIILPYALNSRIYCNGDITISGQGCYNSKIHAGGFLRVNGFVRGGELYAGLGAEIAELGAKAGTSTRVMVPADKTIKIGVAMEDSIIQIGNRVHKFAEETRNIVAKLNSDGKLVLR